MNTLPVLATLWTHDKHGLILLTGIKPLANTGSNEMLYTFEVLRVKDNFQTEGIFDLTDWHRQFTHVA